MKISIRVDGRHEIGLGHIYKSTWLADELKKRSFKVVFLTAEDPVALDLIQRKKFDVVPLNVSWNENQKVEAINAWVSQQKPAALIIDHWN